MDFAKPNSQMREGNMEDDDPIEELEMANRDGVVITSNSNKGKIIEFTSHDEDNDKYFAQKKKKPIMLVANSISTTKNTKTTNTNSLTKIR
jgi:hypothetical protein